MPVDEGERADLLAALGQARHFLRFTVRDLDDARARQRTTVSALCLGGVVKHVTEVERAWTRFIVQGTDAMSFEGEAAAEAHRRGFDMTRDETLAGLLDAYGEVAESTDRLVATLPDLDRSHPLPPAPWFPPGAAWSARRALLHVVAETAQHAGHADIIRESLDGARSMG
ncbi:MAG: DinB family protein [Acidimicrobiales bacterium]